MLRQLKTQSDAKGLRWIGATVVAGELNHSVGIFAYADFASLARGADAMHSAWKILPEAARPQLKSHVYQLTPEQSYNDGHVLWKEAGAFVLYFTELASGAYDDYAEQQKIAASYLAKAHVQDEEWVGFSMRFGHGAPGYVFVTPLRSVAELDSIASHGDVLPPEVDKARSAVLLRAIKSDAFLLVRVRAEISQFGE